ncbi:MAG: DUF2489 domain-containing protein [Paraglaciecola sp.]|uniref:DUF2489 domain-containing protein n=1 Tax=Paraglaciecola sp. TaxID=1920173 RepID=UPI00273D6249|nr:DUF2489 domain-containing protein [Paraglaciecola sp.]MDP5032695.1 DUF2489 domain-containing protein [Paraglaciecola sp.]MDP5039357.1 DUF2489 domain-containing protein [Paraglaciecola sp.]MDP5134151.1 DUF2489 domain-containing protein [Paraglaciecola sp.]
MTFLILILMLVIVTAMAFYAGRLLYKLRAQNKLKEARRKERLTNIIESINTIAAAMAQQQCNLSEGSIRLYHLLEALPVLNKPNYADIYTGVYALFEQVKDLPSHEERKQLSTGERKVQDTFREECEARLETTILKDVAQLKEFSI